MTLRIALCIPSLPLSGVGTSVGIIYAGLRDAGYETDVVVTGWQLGDDYQRAVTDGWSIHAAGEGIRFLPDRLKSTVESLRDYDVVINNTSFETQMVLPCLPSSQVRISVVRASNQDSFFNASWNSRHVNATVGISRDMVCALEHAPDMESQVHLIPNCTKAQSHTLPNLNSPVQIAYVGRVATRQKNVLILPSVLTHLRNQGIAFHATVAGDGEALKALRQQCMKRGLNGQIDFLGSVPRADALELLRKCHFSLMPSHFEGLSNVMLESMAVGCVPIVSDAIDFDWVLGDVASCLQGPVNDAAGYANRLVSLVRNQKQYREIQEHLRSRQKTMFDPRVTVRSYVELIEKCCRESRSFEMVPFTELQVPQRYQRYCTSWWRVLQRIRRTARQCLRPL